MLARPSEQPPFTSAYGPMAPERFEVIAKRQETADTWTLDLRPRDRVDFPFAPGQFTMISAAGAGEVPISISGPADDPAVLVHTVRVVGLATEAICAATVGQVLAVRGPFGGSWPTEVARGADLVIVAGGIGLAPLRPALVHALAHRDEYRRVVLLYGGRSPDQLLYPEELARWAERGCEVLITVDSAGPEWLGHVGVVTRLLRRAAIHPQRSFVLMCGPEVMMRFVLETASAQGISADRVYASLERNMQCGIGHCGHCQLGPTLVCRDGPVYRWDELGPWLEIREL